MNNWDTEETSRIIANDEGLYNLACVIGRDHDAEDLMKATFEHVIESFPYSDITLSEIDWKVIVEDYQEE